MSDSELTTVYTIGHSNHPIERLLSLLGEHKIQTPVELIGRADIIHRLRFNQELGVTPDTWSRGAEDHK